MNNSATINTLLNEIVEKIKRQYQPEKIILFGSHAYGDPSENSDVDLLIVKETKDRPIDRRLAVRRIVSDPRCHLPIEILVLTPSEISSRLEIGDQFVKEILEKGEVLFAV